MRLMLDSRQRAMLAEMGIKVWLPATPPQPHSPQPSSQAPVPQVPPVATASAAPALPITPLAALQQAVAASVPPSASEVANALVATVAAVPAVDGAVLSSSDHQGLPVSSQVNSNSCEKEGIPIENEQNATRLNAATPPIARAVTPAAPVALVPPVPLGPVADMGWPELREAVGGCQACGLCASRTQTVFGVGAERADWMVIGEAPGEQEDLRGEPFVGPAGQLLDAMLHAVGVNRQAPEGEQAVFIANVLKCRPPANRNPLPDEMARCQPYLRRQVALVQPKIILAMGRFAVQALLGTTEPIGRLRQQVHSYEGVPVIVTYHPAYLLRNLPEKAKAWADLVLAMQVAQQANTASAT